MMSGRRLGLVGTVGAVALIGTGCAGSHANWGSINEAVAVIHPTEGNTCHGVVRFTKVDGGVKIVADLEGLGSTSAEHAFHVHQYGDATMGNGKSAGGHYNPEGMPHGRPTDAKRHAGDLGNIVSDGSGRAHYERLDHRMTIAGPTNPILGRGVIVHAGRDKWVQPTGAAGSRIGIGVIGVAKPSGK